MKKTKNQTPNLLAMLSLGAIICTSIYCKKSPQEILRDDLSTIPTKTLREYVEFMKEDTTQKKSSSLSLPSGFPRDLACGD
jgi:hypothetical protein